MTDEEIKRLVSENNHNKETSKPRFDGTINLGHVITFLSMGAALVTMYTNDQVWRADHDSRMKYVEASELELRKSIDKLSETQMMETRALDRVNLTIERIADKK